MSKEKIRKELIEKRKNISNKETKSEKIIKQLFETEEYKKGGEY